MDLSDRMDTSSDEEQVPRNPTPPPPFFQTSFDRLRAEENRAGSNSNPSDHNSLREDGSGSQWNPWSSTISSSVWLRESIQLNFFPPRYRAPFMRRARARLETAKRAGARLDELAIDEDCLLVWPDFNWDPNRQPLHTTIQERLIDMEVVRRMGNLMQTEIIVKTNRRLAQARNLGVEIEHLFIGTNYLPFWSSTQLGAYDVTRVADEEARLREITMFNRDWWTRTLIPVGRTPEIDNLFSGDFGLGIDDIITLHNLLHTEPTYEDVDDLHDVHVMHDVELVDEFGLASEVDIEVYVIESDDDDELALMFEVELSIDRDAYHYYYDDDEAIDVEMPGSRLFVFNGVEEVSSDESDDEPGYAARRAYSPPDTSHFRAFFDPPEPPLATGPAPPRAPSHAGTPQPTTGTASRQDPRGAGSNMPRNFRSPFIIVDEPPPGTGIGEEESLLVEAQMPTFEEASARESRVSAGYVADMDEDPDDDEMDWE